MHFQNTILGSLAVGVALAQKNVGPVGLPINGQNGALHFPLACSIQGQNQVFDGLFTATLPVVGGPGQDTYLTDATIQVTVPPSQLNNRAAKAGVTQLSAFIKGNFTGTNTAQKTFPIFPRGLQVNNISFSSGKDVVLQAPAKGDTLPPIGPITLGKKEGRAVVYFESLYVVLNLQDKSGKDVMSNIPVTCAQPDPNIVLFTMSVSGKSGQAPLYIQPTQKATYEKTPDNFAVGSFRFPYKCDMGDLGSHEIDLSLTGTVPTALTPGGKFNITHPSSFLRLPSSIATDLVRKYPKLASYKTVVHSFFVTTAAASPAKINAIQKPLEVNIGSSNGSLTIAVPESGFLPPVGPITANKKGTVFIGTGNASANIILADRSGKQIADIPVSCAPETPVDFIGFPISSHKPPTFKGN